MTYSRTDLATRILKDLGLVTPEESLSADDLDWAGETLDGEIAMLSAIGLPIWNGSEMSIPQEYLTPLSRRIGLAIAPSYGLMDPASAQLAIREAERNLTIMANPRSRPLPLITNDAAPPRGSHFDFTTGQ